MPKNQTKKKTIISKLSMAGYFQHYRFAGGNEYQVEKDSYSKSRLIILQYTRDSNNKLIPKLNDHQSRWFKFLRTQFKNEDDINQLCKNSVLQFVINDRLENEIFFENLPHLNLKVIPESRFSQIDIRVVLVKRYTQIPILFENEPLFISIPKPNYKFYFISTSKNSELKREYLQYRKNVILHIRNNSINPDYKIFTTIKGVTSGRLLFEDKILFDDCSKSIPHIVPIRVKHSVFGRLVPKATVPSKIDWSIIDKWNHIPSNIHINGISYKNSGYLSNNNSTVISGILGANGQALPVALLKRKLIEKEAITVAQLLKMIANNIPEFRGQKIAPIESSNLTNEAFYINKFIAYGLEDSKKKSTQLYWDVENKFLVFGASKYKAAKLNTIDGFKKVVNWLMKNKDHNVSVNFGWGPFEIDYIDILGNVKTILFKHYNDFLFQEESPILFTDLLSIQDGYNPIANVALEFSNYLTDNYDFEHKPIDQIISRTEVEKAYALFVLTCYKCYKYCKFIELDLFINEIFLKKWITGKIPFLNPRIIIFIKIYLRIKYPSINRYFSGGENIISATLREIDSQEFLLQPEIWSFFLTTTIIDSEEIISFLENESIGSADPNDIADKAIKILENGYIKSLFCVEKKIKLENIKFDDEMD